MDSNVKVIVPEKNKNTFKVLDVYNPGVQIGEKPIITEIGLWNGSNLNINRKMTFYLQRKNMSSIQLRSGSVVLISNHSGTFEEYMLDARYIQFDTISKFHYSMFLLLEDVWYIIIVSVALICVSLKLFHRLESKYKGLQSSYSWATVTLITTSAIFQQDSSIFPNGYSGRIVFLVLQILSILLYNYYTSSIISSLLSKPPEAFHTLDELGHSRLEIGIEDLPYTITWFTIMNDSDVQYIYKNKKKSQYKELFHITLRKTRQSGLYYNTYDILDKQHEEEKAKNIYLQKKLCNYYQKRRMFHVLHDGRVQMDSQKKYEKQCAIRQRQAKECFERLQRDEYEVGKEIVSSEVGKGHEEKLIERYLKRQRIQLSNIMKIRLDFIKIRNRFNEKQETLNALDNLGPDLHLIDYEQLKLDNRNLQDKLEEKELELTRVRAKCQNAVQILAHRREKTAALDVDITHLQERLEGVEGEYEDVREQLNALKQERDAYRSAIAKMKIKSGLLSRPTLLRDMCHKIKEIETLSDHLFDLRGECLDTMKKVNRLKKNMSSETTLKRIKEIMTGIEESVKSLTMFEKLQKAEKDASKELFGTESEGKATAEKFVERYLKRQRLQFGALSRMRLEYIKLRNNYIDKQEALNSLDNLGPNLHLIDYEQLKCDNRNLCDKLEEKELSLASLRRKCQNVMQILAHQREKATAIEVDIQSYNDRLESVMDEFADVREQLSTMKQERDDYRRGANKLKDQAGLLTRPKLLRDMESAIMEAEEGWAKLDEYKE
ncbi:unnamed protein product, partial [Tenebrio molitor]